DVGDAALLGERRKRDWERTELRLVDGRDAGCLLRGREKVAERRLRWQYSDEVLWLDSSQIETNSEDVVLVDARIDSPLPHRTTPEFVWVTPFCHQHITPLEPKPVELGRK